MLSPRPSHFSRTTMKGWEWPGDEANNMAHAPKIGTSLNGAELFAVLIEIIAVSILFQCLGLLFMLFWEEAHGFWAI